MAGFKLNLRTCPLRKRLQRAVKIAALGRVGQSGWSEDATKTGHEGPDHSANLTVGNSETRRRVIRRSL